jgi:predicted permease
MVVIFTLGVGISATSIVFSVINGVLLAPLPYGHPERLVVIRAGLPGQQQAAAPLSGPELAALQERAQTLEAAGGIWARPGVLGTYPSAAEIEVGWITPGLLEALAVTPQLGRLPTPNEYLRTDVMVVSDTLWRQQLGGDPSIVGRRVDFDGEPRTVTAVMPRGFRMLFPLQDGVPASIQAWLPWGAALRTMPRTFRVFTAVGQVTSSPGGGLDGDLRAVAAAIASESSDYAQSGFELSAQPLGDALVATVRRTLLVLLAVVTLVCLIACANVASLLLTRASERSTEFALRLALGADRHRIWRAILTESALIGAGGAMVGLAFAHQGTALLRQLNPAGIPRVQEIAVDAATLAATTVVAMVAALFFGSVAARYAMSVAPLVHQTRRGSSAQTSRIQRWLVIAQVALSVVLLIGAGLVVRSVRMLNDVGLGFAPDHVLTVRVSLPDVRYPYATDGSAIAEFYRRLDEALLNIPGVRAAGATLSPPLASSPLRPRPYAYRTPGGDIEWGAVAANYRTVTPGWFQASGVRPVSGRLLDDRDRWDRPLAVVVDSTLARRAWPARDAVGQAIRVELFKNGVFSPQWGEVVGVIEPVRLNSLVEPEREQLYLAHHQAPQRTMFPTILTSGDPLLVVPRVQSAVHELEAGLPVFDVLPAASYVRNATARTRFAMIALGSFAVTAALLAAAGIFAALAASVTRRAREIGIRLALGSSPAAVFRWTLAEGLAPVGAGVGMGVAAATVVTRFVSSLLFGVAPTDSLTMICVIALVIVIALLACSLPAARAAQIDPCNSLRSP